MSYKPDDYTSVSPLLVVEEPQAALDDPAGNTWWIGTLVD
jgi:hypothetical protein